MKPRNLSDVIDELAHRARAGRLSRRDVLKRGMAIGLSAPVIAGLLAACGGDEDDDANPTNTTASGASEPTSTSAAAADPTETTATGADPTATTGDEVEATEPAAEATQPAEPVGEAGGGGLLVGSPGTELEFAL